MISRCQLCQQLWAHYACRSEENHFEYLTRYCPICLIRAHKEGRTELMVAS